MTSYNSSLLKLLDERGYVHQLTDAAGLDAFMVTVPGGHTSRAELLQHMDWRARVFGINKLSPLKRTSSKE